MKLAAPPYYPTHLYDFVAHLSEGVGHAHRDRADRVGSGKVFPSVEVKNPCGAVAFAQLQELLRCCEPKFVVQIVAYRYVIVENARGATSKATVNTRFRAG